MVKTTSNMSSSDIPNKSTRLSKNQETTHVPELIPASDSSCSAYENYIMLAELKRVWENQEFPAWQNEHILKPALQGLELTFRFISTALFDPRPYINKKETNRRLGNLATLQVEIIAALCDDEERDTQAPILKTTGTSETSLLPALLRWQRSEDVATKIFHTIEREMTNCPYTLGLGETNSSNKPSLNYDLICKPLKLHSLQQGSSETETWNSQNYENQTLLTIHQILETWTFVAKQVVGKLVSLISSKEYSKASSCCWLLEKMWKLFTDIEDAHLLMDPDDFLRLKNQLSIKARTESELFCFRSKGLIEITKLSKELRHKVPEIVEAEVDPGGGPTVQREAMKLYRKKDRFERIHLLQGMQAVEMGVKRFYYSYKQLLVVVLGSLEANGNRGLRGSDSGHLLDQIFLDQSYYPSLDAAKTFLGYYYWNHKGELSVT